MSYQTIHEEFEIKIPTRHVEFKLSHAESVDSLYREGFRDPFQIHWLTCLLERWDHPDGRYKLVAYKGGGIYICEDVNDPQWKEIIDLVYSEDQPPIPLVSEDWLELEIISDDAHTGVAHVRYFSFDQIPTTLGERRKFLRRYHGMVGQFGECTISLKNGRSGEIVFSDTIRKNRDGSVGKVTRKRPKISQ
jgi:hypothetical protein